MKVSASATDCQPCTLPDTRGHFAEGFIYAYAKMPDLGEDQSQLKYLEPHEDVGRG